MEEEIIFVFYEYYNTICSSVWLGILVVNMSDLQLNGRENDPRPLHYRSVGTANCDG